MAVIGDSTFFHSGVTGLIDMIWNNGNAVVVIQDNRITAMTGGQDNPGSGHTLSGAESPADRHRETGDRPGRDPRERPGGQLL